MRNATKNASVAIPTPKIRAISTSLTNPRMRETSVMPLTVASVLRRFMVEYVTPNSLAVHMNRGRGIQSIMNSLTDMEMDGS
jgi:hypothetical protein